MRTIFIVQEITDGDGGISPFESRQGAIEYMDSIVDELEGCREQASCTEVLDGRSPSEKYDKLREEFLAGKVDQFAVHNDDDNSWGCFGTVVMIFATELNP